MKKSIGRDNLEYPANGFSQALVALSQNNNEDDDFQVENEYYQLVKHDKYPLRTVNSGSSDQRKTNKHIKQNSGLLDSLMHKRRPSKTSAESVRSSTNHQMTNKKASSKNKMQQI